MSAVGYGYLKIVYGFGDVPGERFVRGLSTASGEIGSLKFLSAGESCGRPDRNWGGVNEIRWAFGFSFETVSASFFLIDAAEYKAVAEFTDGSFGTEGPSFVVLSDTAAGV